MKRIHLFVDTSAVSKYEMMKAYDGLKDRLFALQHDHKFDFLLSELAMIYPQETADLYGELLSILVDTVIKTDPFAGD